MKICIDPGHGGFDPGACGYGLKESDVNLKYALLLRQLLTQKGHQVIMTRETDKTMSLGERTRFANNNKADLFISCHCNAAANPQAHGVETLVYSDKSVSAYYLARAIVESLEKDCSLKSRGVKFRRKLYVLKNTKMPAILIELGFISNEQEAKRLAHLDFLKLAAYTIADEIRG